MPDISIVIISVVFSMLLLVYLAPGVLAANRGKLMQNIALWLLVFIVLGFIYKNFGPESSSPMFTLPEGMRPFHTDFAAKKKEQEASDKTDKDAKTQPDKEEKSSDKPKEGAAPSDAEKPSPAPKQD